MNEEMNAGVEMKVKTPQEQIEEIQAGNEQPEITVNGVPVLPPKIRLVRTDQGLMMSTDESVPEVDSPFPLLQPGDDVNHQLVESVEEVDGKYKVHLDYFGIKTELSDPNEVFSIFLKEQQDAFKNSIKDFVESFDGKFVPEYILTNPDIVLRAVELLCAKVNMNEIQGIVVGNEGVDLALASIIGTSLRKPVFVINGDKKFEPEEQTNVVLFTEGYVRKATDDTLSFMGPDTKFYLSYQLSLFDAEYINKHMEYEILDPDGALRTDLDRSNDIVIIRDDKKEAE